MSREEQAGSPELPPIKELYLERQGREFLFRSGYAEFFEETKSLPFFEEIHLSCKTAIRELNVGTPKGLKADSMAEQEQLELLFMELRHGDLTLALKKYSSLIEKYSNDRVFVTALARTIKRRSTPSSTRQSLRFYVPVGWTYGFLWGASKVAVGSCSTPPSSMVVAVPCPKIIPNKRPKTKLGEALIAA